MTRTLVQPPASSQLALTFANEVRIAFAKMRMDLSWRRRLPNASRVDESIVLASKKFIDACKEGSRAKAEAALAEGADRNATSEFGRTGLIWAILKGHEEFAVWLMEEKKADVDIKDCTGNNALSYCADLNLIKAAKVAIKRDANPFSKNNAGFTPAMLAKTRRYEKMQALLDGATSPAISL